jgi:hypothetical protein
MTLAAKSRLRYLVILLIIYMTVILIPIPTNGNEYANPTHSQRRSYVKKRHRWIRARQLIKLIAFYTACVWAQIGQYETTWYEYKARRGNSQRIRRAQLNIITANRAVQRRRKTVMSDSYYSIIVRWKEG